MNGSLTEHIPSYSVSPAAHWLNCCEERTDKQSMFTPETMKTERENWRARAEQVYTGDHEDGERELTSTSRACLHRRPWRRRERTDEHEQSRFTPETMKTERENWRARAEQVYTGDHEDGERELTSTSRAGLHRRPWRRRERTDEHEQSRFTPETMKTERENWRARAEQVYTGDHEDGERERTSTSRAGLHRRPWRRRERTDEHEQSMLTPETMKTERENWRARAEQVYTGDHEDGERELTSTSRACLHRRPWRRRERTDEHEQSMLTPETMKTERENWRARAEQVYTGDHEDGERELTSTSRACLHRRPWRRRERTDEHEQSMFTPETMKTERENWRARAEHVNTGDHEDGERELTSTSRACLHRRPWRRRERTDEHEQSMFTPETMKTERENWRARAEHVYTGDHEDGERELTSTSRAGLHRRPWRQRERTDEHEQSMFTPETMKTERENWRARAEQVYTGDHEDGERELTSTSRAGLHWRPWRRRERTDEHEQSRFTPETMKTERENGWARAEQVYTGDHEDGERELTSTSRAGLHRRPWRRRERTDEHEQSRFTPETMERLEAPHGRKWICVSSFTKPFCFCFKFRNYII